MTLWHVHRDDCDYDEYDAFIIRAESSEEALAIATKNEPARTVRPYGGKRGEGTPVVWHVDPVTVDGEVGVILGSFNAG